MNFIKNIITKCKYMFNPWSMKLNYNQKGVTVSFFYKGNFVENRFISEEEIKYGLCYLVRYYEHVADFVVIPLMKGKATLKLSCALSTVWSMAKVQ